MVEIVLHQIAIKKSIEINLHHSTKSISMEIYHLYERGCKNGEAFTAAPLVVNQIVPIFAPFNLLMFASPTLSQPPLNDKTITNFATIYKKKKREREREIKM
ncbi:hypothetical protein ACOSP7_015664 [Xanthoceras sorbifolium]